MKSGGFRQISEKLGIPLIALFWLVGITCLHLVLNGEPRARNVVAMGYMPVITNLAAPLVDFASKDSEVHFQAIKFASFAEMADAFRSGHIEAAFIIAPLAIVMYQQKVPLKVVTIGNRHESTLVVRKDLPYGSLSEMRGRTLAVPTRYSGHSLALRRFFRDRGLSPDSVRMVEVPPPDMPSALASGGIDGYFVGEPFAAKAIQAGIGRKLLYVEEIWPGFICNLTIVREELIREHPERVQGLVSASVRSCLYAQRHLKEIETIVGRYWGQAPELISFAFSTPPGRIRFDLFVPKIEEMEEIQREMCDAGLLQTPIDLRGMVEPRFALAVEQEPARSLGEVLRP